MDNRAKELGHLRARGTRILSRWGAILETQAIAEGDDEVCGIIR